jgi:two-component system, NarL family, sensor histidine kinase DevS
MTSPSEPAGPSGSSRDADIMRERDRIAAELQNEVIQRVFAVGLNLQGTAAITVDPLVRRRIDQATDDLDHVVQVIRDAVFHLETRLKGQGLRAGIVHLCEQLSTVPDVTFHGPVDGALHPATAAELLDILDDALTVIGRRWALAAIDVTAADGGHVTMMQAVPLPDARGAAESDDDSFPGLRDRAARAGLRIEIKREPESVQISWHAA